MYNGQLNVMPPSSLSKISQALQAGFPSPTSPGTLTNWRGLGMATNHDSDRIYAKKALCGGTPHSSTVNCVFSGLDELYPASGMTAVIVEF